MASQAVEEVEVGEVKEVKDNRNVGAKMEEYTQALASEVEQARARRDVLLATLATKKSELAVDMERRETTASPEVMRKSGTHVAEDTGVPLDERV